jgi:hypothetical protein
MVGGLLYVLRCTTLWYKVAKDARHRGAFEAFSLVYSPNIAKHFRKAI